jgi:hypothetical protein
MTELLAKKFKGVLKRCPWPEKTGGHKIAIFGKKLQYRGPKISYNY